MRFAARFLAISLIALSVGCGGTGTDSAAFIASVNTYRVVFIPAYAPLSTPKPWEVKGGMYVTTFDRKTRLLGDANNTGEEVIDAMVSLPTFKPGSEDKLEFLEREGTVSNVAFRLPAAKLAAPEEGVLPRFALILRDLVGDSFASSFSTPRRFEKIANGEYELKAAYPSTGEDDDLVGIVPPVQSRILTPDPAEVGKFRIRGASSNYFRTFSGDLGTPKDLTPRFFGGAMVSQLRLGVEGVQRKIFKVDLVVVDKPEVSATYRRVPPFTEGVLAGSSEWFYQLDLSDNGMSINPDSNKAFASLYAALGTGQLRVRVYWGDESATALDVTKFTDLKLEAVRVPSGVI